LFPTTWRVGHGYLPDVENSHNYKAIKELPFDQPNTVLQIGSPYLRYWLDPVEAPVSEFRKQVNERQPKLTVETGLMGLDGKVEIFS
jgi:hypothetical protein